MKRLASGGTGLFARFRRLIMIVLVLTPGLAVTAVNADELTFELRIEHGQLPPDMRLIQVKQGDVVKLRWSTDRPIALHLHGYDIERKVEPGMVTEMIFTARATGRFPVAEHQAQPGGGHTHGAPIVQLEVLPR